MTGFDAEAFLAARTPHRQHISIVTKNDLTDRVATLEAQLAAARRLDQRENRIPEAPRIESALEQLRDDIRASSQEFWFREIPRFEYETLAASHPPRKEDRTAGAEWHAETFPPALIAAASDDPKLTTQAATALWRGLPFGEARKLWLTALACQSKVGAVPLPVSGIAATATTATSSDTAHPEESPAASS